jgi:hypothetical protein
VDMMTPFVVGDTPVHGRDDRDAWVVAAGSGPLLHLVDHEFRVYYIILSCVVLMSEPQDPLGVAVGDLLPVAVAERGPLKPGDRFVAGLKGVVDGEHDGVGSDLQHGAGERGG